MKKDNDSLSPTKEMLDAIRGIQRGLDEAKAGAGKPALQVLEEIRAKYKIPRRVKLDSKKKKTL